MLKDTNFVVRLLHTGSVPVTCSFCSQPMAQPSTQEGSAQHTGPYIVLAQVEAGQTIKAFQTEPCRLQGTCVPMGKADKCHGRNAAQLTLRQGRHICWIPRSLKFRRVMLKSSVLLSVQHDMPVHQHAGKELPRAQSLLLRPMLELNACAKVFKSTAKSPALGNA